MKQKKKKFLEKVFFFQIDSLKIEEKLIVNHKMHLFRKFF